ncbi:MAG: phosphatase PAP2 family protein [Bdellovibrionales bacterium]|nr:phosphatase PAP2 family protein [Bdellovibrionales bacterium]
MPRTRLTELFQTLRRAPRLTRMDAGLLIGSAALWAALGLLGMPAVAKLQCKHDHAACAPHTVNSFDRDTVKRNDREARSRSDWLQNGSGAVAIFAPLGLFAARAAMGAMAWPAALAAWGTELALLAEATFLNGAVNSVVRMTVQRPRPGVYRSPHGNGGAPMMYTSFYSGHTSFAAVAVFSLWLCWFSRLRGGRARGALLWLTGLGGLATIVGTGYYRVMGGSHFPSDVIAAPWVPAALCLALAVLHRHNSRAIP